MSKHNSSISMLSILTIEENIGGMIFSLFFVCWFISKNLKGPNKRGVHYKSFYRILDGYVYLNSLCLNPLVRLDFLLVYLGKLSMIL